jgi:hypothetical protein
MSTREISKLNFEGPKVGTVAISTINFDDWCSGGFVSQDKNGKKKTRQTKEVVNTIFSECANCSICITDPFWVEKFSAAALNKFPKGFSYRDNMLIYKKPGKDPISINVSNNAVEAASACMEFFKTTTNLMSPKDKEREIQLLYELNKRNNAKDPLSWKTSCKNMRTSMICNYITDMKNTMKLSLEETDQLYNVVKVGITKKYFTKDNIVIQNNRIYSIGGLLWDDKKRNFYIDQRLTPAVSKSSSKKPADRSERLDKEDKDTIPHFYEKWEKYTDNVRKNTFVPSHKLKEITIKHTILPPSRRSKMSSTATDVTVSSSRTSMSTDTDSTSVRDFSRTDASITTDDD